ncbi:hypothetical protein J7E73_17815 [Paenibacillus albidus]|uniref:hypothetical protein n=1 Tax=Paenibacillus albidus TaxID=2041023 RepID=UPI001BE522BD|nr:hypothetical protein [Paenibacillus albidus]MBT2290958.1 hypothetical protein [Paenibacillus albidus]
MKTKMLFLIATILLLIGCSNDKFKPDTFSEKDLAIYKVDNEKEVVSYGMSREDAEKVLGKPGKTSFGVEYDFGVKVMYRNDSVALIYLSTGSEDIYKTSRGAMVGMSKEELTKLYGEKYALDNLIFYYDAKSKHFLGQTSIDSISSAEDAEGIYIFSSMNHPDGSGSLSLSLGDLKGFKYLD